MSLKTAATRFGSALIDVANEMHNQSIRNQIEQIDDQQNALRAQLTRLEQERSEQMTKLI
jgi:hypothetical protein